MGRILSIDYGKKRTGIAVTDPTRTIANPLTTVETNVLLDFISQYIETEDVDGIIVGKPLQPNGEASENMKRVEPFFNRLKKLYPELSVEYYDERFTSVLAHKAMIDSGIGRKARQDKALVDKISASIILEDYLENRRIQSERENKNNS